MIECGLHQNVDSTPASQRANRYELDDLEPHCSSSDAESMVISAPCSSRVFQWACASVACIAIYRRCGQCTERSKPPEMRPGWCEMTRQFCPVFWPGAQRLGTARYARNRPGRGGRPRPFARAAMTKITREDQGISRWQGATLARDRRPESAGFNPAAPLTAAMTNRRDGPPRLCFFGGGKSQRFRPGAASVRCNGTGQRHLSVRVRRAGSATAATKRASNSSPDRQSLQLVCAVNA